MYKQNNQSKNTNEIKRKRNFTLPAFINSDGVVIAQTVGVKVPVAESNRVEEKKMLLEMALRNFKRKVKESGVIESYKERQQYIKKSVRKRQAKMAAVRKAQYEFQMIND